MAGFSSGFSSGFDSAPIASTTEFTTEFTSEFGQTGTPAARGNSSVTLPLLKSAGSGTRAVPTRTGTSASSIPRFKHDAFGIVNGVPQTLNGTSTVFLPRFTSSATGTRTLPTRTGTASVTLPVFRQEATGKRMFPGASTNVSHILAPEWRTADFGTGLDSVSWRSALDPGELKAYTINCSTELSASGTRIQGVNLGLSGIAALAGLRIHAQTSDETTVTVWFKVAPEDQAKANWNGAGETHTLVCTITAADGQIFERTIALRIAQLGQ